MGKNGYLERQKQTIQRWRLAERETTIQFMTDTLILTLNNPEVMGKNTFGKERIKRILKGWGEIFSQFSNCLNSGPETDWCQDKLDERLRAILGDEGFLTFHERYEWVKEQKY